MSQVLAQDPSEAHMMYTPAVAPQGVKRAAAKAKADRKRRVRKRSKIQLARNLGDYDSILLSHSGHYSYGDGCEKYGDTMDMKIQRYMCLNESDLRLHFDAYISHLSPFLPRVLSSLVKEYLISPVDVVFEDIESYFREAIAPMMRLNCQALNNNNGNARKDKKQVRCCERRIKDILRMNTPNSPLTPSVPFIDTDMLTGYIAPQYILKSPSECRIREVAKYLDPSCSSCMLTFYSKMHPYLSREFKKSLIVMNMKFYVEAFQKYDINEVIIRRDEELDMLNAFYVRRFNLDEEDEQDRLAEDIRLKCDNEISSIEEDAVRSGTMKMRGILSQLCNIEIARLIAPAFDESY